MHVGTPQFERQMTKHDARKGARVEFVGPKELSTLGGQAGSALLGKKGAIVYGISEDSFCYPENPQMNRVSAAFDEDRLPRRQASLDWLKIAGF
jgi:hypothetical protein